MPPAPKRNNAQHQPLTTVLRNIIREYPAGGGVLRELCQNADDAGATEVVFVLDRKKDHPTDNLLHPDLAEFQGPALLAYNNSQFEERDFDSLSRIGDSEKAKDLSSTGKFGRGFNSVGLLPASHPMSPQCYMCLIRVHNRCTIGPTPHLLSQETIS